MSAAAAPTLSPIGLDMAEAALEHAELVDGDAALRREVAELVLRTYQDAAEPESEFPLDSYREAARHLRRPFTPEAIKFKVQATWGKVGNQGEEAKQPTTALVVCYIDARLVVERLNLLVPHLWSDPVYEPVGAGKGLVCRLTVDGITRQDVGEGVGKALYSDAFKRAAVKFGIGVSCYAIPKMIVKGDEKVRLRKTKQGWTLELTSDGEAQVRAVYAQWLGARGTAAFGDPLDHGDSPEAQGDFEAEEAREAQEERGGQPPEALDDEQANAQRQQAEDLFTEIKALDKRALTRKAFDNYLVSAQHSHDRLDDLLGFLRGKRDELKAAA